MSSQGAGYTSSLTRVATVLVESCEYHALLCSACSRSPGMLTERAGAIYSVLLFLLIGLYAGGSPGMFVVLDLVRTPLPPARPLS